MNKVSNTSRFRKVTRGLAAALLATGGLVAVAPAATAHESIQSMVLTGNGEWKAYASLNTRTGLLCVRAYHSVPSAWAEVLIAQQYVQNQAVRDRGGDTEKSCTYVGGFRHGERASMYIFHVSSTGQQISDYMSFTY